MTESTVKVVSTIIVVALVCFAIYYFSEVILAILKSISDRIQGE